MKLKKVTNSKTTSTPKKSKSLTWIAKLEKEGSPKVKHLDKRFVDIPEDSDMLVATPQIFEEYLKKSKPGITIPIKKMRDDLAKKFRADHTCPVTTGLFLRIVAEANYEKFAKGTPVTDLAPFWRAVEPNSSLAKKLSFPLDFVWEQRKKEGIA